METELLNPYTSGKRNFLFFQETELSYTFVNETYLYFGKGIFRTLVYSEPWYIQNPGIFRGLAYLKPGTYSEHCQTSMRKRFVKLERFVKIALKIKKVIIFSCSNIKKFLIF